MRADWAGAKGEGPVGRAPPSIPTPPDKTTALIPTWQHAPAIGEVTATLHATRTVKRRIILSTPLKDVTERLKDGSPLPYDWKLSADVESIKKV